MRLVLQIALGVFLGTLASQAVVEIWRAHQEHATRAAAEHFEAQKERTRRELSERVRSLLMQGRQEDQTGLRKPPPGFIPDDAEPPPKQ